MKIKITEVRSQKSEAGSLPISGLRLPPAALRPPSSRQGMALIITLILLSITLVMAIAFLAVSRRERVSVTTSTEITTARFAADTALASAQAQIVANIIASTNVALYNNTLLVSTNYINYNGFDPLLGASPNNVNYDYTTAAGNPPLTVAQELQNVANLQFLPRPPVMVSPAEPRAGRFYLDLNRNGAFEPIGAGISVVDAFGVTNGTAFQSGGDPQWVGILERPGTPHSPDNKFLSRYAYICLPIGDSLDINAIHNQSITKTVNPNAGASVPDGYFRNQGVGSWEINLAAFLADLNTNQWLPTIAPDNNYYAYNEPSANFNLGRAFDDARALLSWRYNFSYINLASANQLFPNPNIWRFDNIDEYGDSPLQLTTTNINESLIANQDTPAFSWAGANNPNRFYTPGDFFDPAKSSGGFGSFTNRLLNAGTTTAANGAHPTYDRYTFYRMLEQLGTDSLPDSEGKLNLNYSNAVVSYDSFGAYLGTTFINGAETNLVPWAATNFFCAAADQLLKVYTTNWFQKDPTNFLATYYSIPNYDYYYSYVDANGNTVTLHNDPNGYGLTNIPYLGITNRIPAFGLANIPVLVSNKFVYSPSINRLLQLAANIYDAGTNEFFPHVYRPIFYRNNFGDRDVFIVGYKEIVNANVAPFPLAQLPIHVADLPNGITVNNVYGLPWIIGAKKGFPNFNQYVARNDVQLTRKLQLTRTKVEPYTSATSGDFGTNQMFVMSITNHIGFSFWNSYAADYVASSPNSLSVVARDSVQMWLTNGAPRVWYTSNTFTFSRLNFNVWTGAQWSASSAPESRQALSTSFIASTFDFPFLPESIYRMGAAQFVPVSPTPVPLWETNLSPSTAPLPQFGLMTTNGFQAYILDGTHVIDYVHFSGPSGSRDLNTEIMDNYSGMNASPYQQWITNASGVGGTGPNLGLVNQILVSKKGPGVAPPNTINSWKAPPNMPPGTANPDGEAAYFSGFFAPIWGYAGKIYTNTQLVVQAPYTPTRTTYIYTIWAANDPLVHYLTSDLNEQNADAGLKRSDDPVNQALPDMQSRLSTVGARYQPWGRSEQMDGINGALHGYSAQYNLAFKDPQVYGSDNWDFPTNQYPSIGWLGRVHRGTPWQSVYLKATNLLEFAPKDNNGDINYYGLNTWLAWLGDSDIYDAANSRPIQDDLLFDIFTTAPNENASRGKLSVNQSHLAAWSAVLSGMAVPNSMTNTFSFIQPVGAAGTNATLWQIVNYGTNGIAGINATRADTNIFSGGTFKRVGDILRVPALSEGSPFLSGLSASKDVSDELYEWLPQQMLGLLRVSTAPRYVIYSYGQTLKPALDGTVLGSSFFGLVTNYQVVAESTTRAIITVQPVITNTITGGPTTNYQMRVESYDVLPPE